MKRLRGILTGVWMGFIFFQGIQPGEVSIGASDKITHPLVDIIEQVKLTPSEQKERSKGELSSQDEMINQETSNQSKTINREKLYKTVHYIVRKSAHFFEYAILSMLAFWMFKGFSFAFGNQVIYTLFMILSVAVLDEYFQSFVMRTSSVSDVLIDFSGGVFGIMLLTGLCWIFKTYNISYHRLFRKRGSS